MIKNKVNMSHVVSFIDNDVLNVSKNSCKFSEIILRPRDRMISFDVEFSSDVPLSDACVLPLLLK